MQLEMLSRGGGGAHYCTCVMENFEGVQAGWLLVPLRCIGEDTTSDEINDMVISLKNTIIKEIEILSFRE